MAFKSLDRNYIVWPPDPKPESPLKALTHPCTKMMTRNVNKCRSKFDHKRWNTCCCLWKVAKVTKTIYIDVYDRYSSDFALQ